MDRMFSVFTNTGGHLSTQGVYACYQIHWTNKLHTQRNLSWSR